MESWSQGPARPGLQRYSSSAPGCSTIRMAPGINSRHLRCKDRAGVRRQQTMVLALGPQPGSRILHTRCGPLAVVTLLLLLLLAPRRR